MEEIEKFDSFFYPTGDLKVSGITYVAKNTERPWRVLAPGMEAHFFCLFS